MKIYLVEFKIKRENFPGTKRLEIKISPQLG